jgi:hypothetical protein
VWLSTWSERTEPYDLDGVRVVPEAAGQDFPLAVARAHVMVSHLENVPLAADLARGYGVPLIVVCHNTFDLTWEPLVAGSTALAVVNSQWMREAAEAAFAQGSVRPDRLLVVRPPVHAADYATKPGDCITLVNCTATKGIGVLAELAKRMPDRKFLAVRGGYGEQQPPDLDNVLVLDHMSGQRMRDEVYARTRILLMPSDYESWGRAGVEAMASGIPVIAHPTDGLRESLAAATGTGRRSGRVVQGGRRGRPCSRRLAARRSPSCVPVHLPETPTATTSRGRRPRSRCLVAGSLRATVPARAATRLCRAGTRSSPACCCTRRQAQSSAQRTRCA